MVRRPTEPPRLARGGVAAAPELGRCDDRARGDERRRRPGQRGRGIDRRSASRGVGAGTYCVATALLPDPKPAVRVEAKPHAKRKAPGRSQAQPPPGPCEPGGPRHAHPDAASATPGPRATDQAETEAPGAGADLPRPGQHPGVLVRTIRRSRTGHAGGSTIDRRRRVRAVIRRVEHRRRAGCAGVGRRRLGRHSTASAPVRTAGCQPRLAPLRLERDGRGIHSVPCGSRDRNRERGAWSRATAAARASPGFSARRDLLRRARRDADRPRLGRFNLVGQLGWHAGLRTAQPTNGGCAARRVSTRSAGSRSISRSRRAALRSARSAAHPPARGPSATDRWPFATCTSCCRRTARRAWRSPEGGWSGAGGDEVSTTCW